MTRRLHAFALVVALGVATAACTEGSSGSPPSPSATGSLEPLNAIMASTDHYVGAPQRVGLGLVYGDGRLLSYGSVDLRFSYVGTAEAPVQPEAGPSATAVYLPTPGTPNDGTTPTITLPSEARGIYEAEDVTFDRAGFWQVDVIADVEGAGSQRGAATFAVTEEASLPAPGEPALETENLTTSSRDAPPAALDSRARTEDDIPDPQLHEWTIADAVAQGRPAAVLFATPVFCESQFCGPVTDVFEDVARRYDDRAVFIHVEIWRDYETQTANRAAADWLYREGQLTEPWLYLIDADGTIADRWSVLFREEDVAATLEALPPMRV